MVHPQTAGYPETQFCSLLGKTIFILLFLDINFADRFPFFIMSGFRAGLGFQFVLKNQAVSLRKMLLRKPDQL